MNPRDDDKSKLPLAIALAIFAIAIGALAVWYWQRGRDASSGVVSGKVFAEFNVAVAALDVEENERALRALESAVQLEPREPALWADLAIAQLRLNEPEAAHQSLEKAIRLAPDSRELTLLGAQISAHAGQAELAIERLRKVHQVWPENVAATYSLVSLLGQLRTDEAETQRLDLLSDILRQAPGNLQALTEQARVAASLQDAAKLQSALAELEKFRSQWPDKLQEQLDAAQDAVKQNDFRRAALALTFLQNLLKPRPEYQQSLAQLGVLSASAVGTPVRQFLHLSSPPIEAAAADVELNFEIEPIEVDSGTASSKVADADLLLCFERSEGTKPALVWLSGDQLRIDQFEFSLPWANGTYRAISACVAVDLNFDFQLDVVAVGSEGSAIYLGQKDGSFQATQIELPKSNRRWTRVWAHDVDADGDMDLIASDGQADLGWIRNNGDMTFAAMPELLEAAGVVDVRLVDFDNDADVDLVTLDRTGHLVAWKNQRNGVYSASDISKDAGRTAVAVGDLDRDGKFDLVSIDRSGTLMLSTWQASDAWKETELASLTQGAAPAKGSTAAEPPTAEKPDSGKPDSEMPTAFLAVADMDNNGAVDIVASSDAGTHLWLQDAAGSLKSIDSVVDLQGRAVVDFDRDGRLDLVGVRRPAGQDAQGTAAAASVALNGSRAGYRWQVVQPLANPNAGDKRINSFGIGGRIDVRAGNIAQAAPIASPRVHFGLGKREQADLARILWPNGTSQAEFDFEQNQIFTANQRLKGSCPWVFAYDGRGFQFVKDFIWRSPLGLRINAQTTAGVTQTEDWIKLGGDQLAERDGRYSVRITAELWETHFFDHVSLLAVERPADCVVLVDERFVPNQKPQQRVIAATPPRPLSRLVDHRGQSVDAALAKSDGVTVDGFELGAFQGIAEEHWIEFTVPEEAGRESLLIVGQGWIYPTDSSLNVAIAQGDLPAPFGLKLEQCDAGGQWQTVDDNLGFPAGKNKEVAIEVPASALEHGRTFRLRTNMEIYWDSLAWSRALPKIQPRVTRLSVRVAQLRYRGYSRLKPLDRRKPDTPLYEVVRQGPLWLDLEGYYTRFGDVRELLDRVDDRYVIMNAGDELVFEFDASQRTVPNGWQRDFVLVGDGWVKDGDFNTTCSETVGPLPAHDQSEYAASRSELAEDPVARQHAQDWLEYHTRYVTPRPFIDRLWTPSRPLETGDVQE